MPIPGSSWLHSLSTHFWEVSGLSLFPEDSKALFPEVGSATGILRDHGAGPRGTGEMEAILGHVGLNGKSTFFQVRFYFLSALSSSPLDAERLKKGEYHPTSLSPGELQMLSVHEQYDFLHLTSGPLWFFPCLLIFKVDNKYFQFFL